MQGGECGGFCGLLSFTQQGWIQLYFQRLLIARQPDAGSTVLTVALDLHGIEFFLQFLRVLLDLLSLSECLSELSEIGKSKPCHDTNEVMRRLIGRLKAHAFHFRMQSDSMHSLHFVLDEVD